MTADRAAVTLSAEQGGEQVTGGFLDLVGVSKDFGQGNVVDDVNLSLRRGEFFSLLGPSGCGKTTTLRMIAGFEEPTEGQITAEGRDVTRLPPNRRAVNTVFQSYALFSHLDVADNVGFGLREEGIRRAERRRRVADALALVRLVGFERRRPDQLSGGQQQRVALARAIVKEPRVLLLDEPLGALDLKLRRTMQVELKTIQQQLGITFVYVTHDQEEALTMSDRIAVMKAGRIEQIGVPEELYDRPRTRYVAEFVGSANCVPGVIRLADGGDFCVEIAGAFRVRMDRPPPLAAGTSAFVVIRPERCQLREPGRSGGLAGRIAEVMFKGTHWSYLVDTGAGATVSVASPHRFGTDRRRVGDPVEVVWAPGDATVVAD